MSTKLLDRIESFGTNKLKRTNTQHKFFRKNLIVSLHNDFAKMVYEKIDALIDYKDKELIKKMEEISSYLTDDNVFEFDFPIEDPFVHNETTAKDFNDDNHFENFISVDHLSDDVDNDNDDQSTLIDNASNHLDNFNDIQSISNICGNINISDQFIDDLESIISDSSVIDNENNNTIDDDL